MNMFLSTQLGSYRITPSNSRSSLTPRRNTQRKTTRSETNSSYLNVTSNDEDFERTAIYP